MALSLPQSSTAESCTRGQNKGAVFNYEPATAEQLQHVGKIEAVCAAHDVPLAAAALQFPLHHPLVPTCVVGMSSPEEVDKNLEWLELSIPDGFWADLKSESLVHPEVPIQLGGLARA